MTDRLSYRFGPLERHGILGPIRAGQAFALAGAAVIAVAVINAAPTAGGAALATLLFGCAAGLGVLRVGGRALDEWSPVVLAFSWRTVRRRKRFRSSVPTSGWRVRDVGSPLSQLATDELEPPPAVHDVRIRAARHRDADIGVLSSRRGRYLTTVLACRATAFSLLDPAAQESRLGRWGQLLASLANSPVSRLQWVERTAPAQGDELARWVHAARDPAVPLRGTAMIDSYLELIGTSAKVAHEHEILLALQVDTSRVRERGSDAATRTVLEHTERLAQGLEGARVGVLGALTPGQLARALRTAFDPYARGEIASLEAVDVAGTALPETSAWPLGAHESWEHYRSDGAFHSTYWIGAWPRVEVSAMFMDALLGRSSSVRTVTVVFEPVPADRSTREAEAAVTRDQADRELRRRFGQSQTARQRQAEEAALRREAELAAGHNEVRFAGFVTVSGRDLEELRRASHEVCDNAARARLELHRMYGQQALAFTFTLPLCRGLR